VSDFCYRTQRYIILAIRETVITVSGSSILNLKIYYSNLSKSYAKVVGIVIYPVKNSTYLNRMLLLRYYILYSINIP